MRRVRIEAEISARSYKKLVEKLRCMNKKQLWKILDHYIFHIMEDNHVDELLNILESFDKAPTAEEPAAAPDPRQPVLEPIEAFAFSLPETETPTDIDQPRPRLHRLFATLITDEDLEHSKGQLDLLYDANYFSYLTRDVAVANAKRLIEFAKANGKEPEASWRLVAERQAFEDIAVADDEEEGDDVL